MLVFGISEAHLSSENFPNPLILLCSESAGYHAAIWLFFHEWENETDHLDFFRYFYICVQYQPWISLTTKNLLKFCDLSNGNFFYRLKSVPRNFWLPFQGRKENFSRTKSPWTSEVYCHQTWDTTDTSWLKFSRSV